MNILPAIVTIILMLGAMAFAGWSLYVILNWPRTSATILRYEEKSGSEGRYYHPVYRFQTSDGKTYEVISTYGSSWVQTWEPGATVPIRYCPTNPQRSEIQSFGNTWGFALTCAALSLMFWAVAFWFPRME